MYPPTPIHLTGSLGMPGLSGARFFCARRRTSSTTTSGRAELAQRHGRVAHLLRRAERTHRRPQRRGGQPPNTLEGIGLLPAPVSYTHLRAHETVLDLVCRLLLEKKK